jgi:hypothetical protein
MGFEQASWLKACLSTEPLTSAFLDGREAMRQRPQSRRCSVLMCRRLDSMLSFRYDDFNHQPLTIGNERSLIAGQHYQ